MSKTRKFLVYSFLIVTTLYFAFHGMALAKSVLAPIFLAIILAMMLSPAANFLEKKGFSRGWSSFFADLLMLIFIFGLFEAVFYEAERLMENWPTIESRLSALFEKVTKVVEKNSTFSVTNPFQQNTDKSGTQAANGISLQQLPITDWGTSILKRVFNLLSVLLLLLVYVFFMLLYRDKFEKAVMMFISDKHQEVGKVILADILDDAQQYLFGHVILIIILAAIYATGFYLSGMQSPFSTALLAAGISFIPYVGTIGGGVLALGMAFITTGNTSAVLIVLVTLIIAQFIESYFIEPYLIGKRVNVNPLFAIFSVIIGAAVWGLIGMIVFLPLFSFIKAVADHVPHLRPIGYAIGKEDATDGKSALAKLAEKIKEKFSQGKS